MERLPRGGKTLTGAGDKLLFVISASGPLTWRSFSRAFDAVVGAEASDGGEGDSRAMRGRSHAFLDAVGHCEVTFRNGGSMITAAPATLARMPLSGLPRAVLLGARQGSTFDEIEAACSKFDGAVQLRLEGAAGSRAAVPTRIEIESEDNAALDSVATQLGVSYQVVPPAWVICSQSATLADVEPRLTWEEGRHLNWKRTVFDPVRLVMSVTERLPEAGLFLMSYEHPYTRLRQFSLWHEGQAADVDKNWGRYAVLRATGRDVLMYDGRRHVLGVPVTAPLPRLLSRAACLCSGRAPSFIAATALGHRRAGALGADLYLSVGPEIASRIAQAVGQSLQSATFDRLDLEDN